MNPRCARLLVACLGLLLAVVAWARPPTPLLWKATRGDTTVYLLGSLHMLQAGDYPLSDDIQHAYDRAAQVLFEIPPRQMGLLGALGPTMAMGMYPDLRHGLADDIDAATWQRLQDYARRNGMSVFALSRMRPWMVSLTILAMETKKLAYDPQRGLDQYFMNKAQADHKRTGGFESVEQQVRILASEPLSEQVRGLQKMMAEMPKFPAQMGQMHDLWRRGDAVAIYRQAMAEFRDEPEMGRRMLEERNRAWVPQIDRLAAAVHGDTLVVVGALHLLGPNGLVELLKRNGYRVERICTACAGVR